MVVLKSLIFQLYSYAPLVLVLATMGWAGNVIIGLLLVGNASAMLFISIRWALLAVFLGAILYRQKLPVVTIIKDNKWWLVGMGTSIALFDGFFYLATNFTSAINIGILQGSVTIFILIGAFLFFAQPIKWLQIVGCALSFFGVVYIVTSGDWQSLAIVGVNRGDFLMLLGCVFYAVYTLGLRKRPAINGFVLLWFIAVFAFVATLPMAIIEYALGYTQFPNAQGWWIMVYAVLVPAYLSQVFFMRGVDLVGVQRAGLYINMVPILSAFMSVLFLNEVFQTFHFIALLLIISGILLSESSTKSIN